MTNLDGPAADELEKLQARYEDANGFRAVVFDGRQALIVVAPEDVDPWQQLLTNTNTEFTVGCVTTWLANAIYQAVDGMNVGPEGFSSVGYDALSDAMTVTTTAPAADVVSAVDAIEPAAAEVAVASGELRISHAESGEFGNVSRGADIAPYWGGGRIRTDIGGCTTGFYLNSSTNGTAMLTAGHCYGGNGVSTDNGDHSAIVGTSEGVHAFDPDVALIDGQTYYQRSYSWNDQTSQKLISEASNPTTGVVYCQMGATSLRICSSYSSLDVDWSNAYTSGPSGPGGSLASAGDSGAGVYRELSGGTLGARGMVNAAGCDATACDRLDTKLQTITSWFSATIFTGN